MGESSSRHRSLRVFSLLTLVFAGAVGVGLWQVAAHQPLAKISADVAWLGTWSSLARAALLGVVALAWRPLLAGLRRRGWIDAPRHAALLAARWRIVGWLVLIEVLVGQQLLSRVVHVWSASG